MRAVVFGASGVIGRALLPELAREHAVVAVSRRQRHGEDGISWVQADAADADSLRGLLREGDVVVYLVHSLGAADFERVDRQAADNVASSAESAGARRIVYLGGPRRRRGRGLRRTCEAGGDRRAARGRAACPVTTLRAAMVVGAGSAAFETIRALVDRLPAMICPRWVSTPTQPIALRDVVALPGRRRAGSSAA